MAGKFRSVDGKYFGVKFGADNFLVAAPEVDVDRSAQGLCGAPCDPPCDRKAKNRGLCAAHYQKWYRGDPIDAPIGSHGAWNKGRESESKACKVEGCGRQHHAKGYCKTHYKRWLEGSCLDAPVQLRLHKPGEPCIYCGRPSEYGGLCPMHAKRRSKGIRMDIPKIPQKLSRRLHKSGMTANEAWSKGILQRWMEEENDGEKH